ncbi:hypothetical protein [Labedella populi]|uniref:hypothetical protein n=1 Tax=Labedella populi TaxID=2498850 RepID=UPI00140CFA91|nr:hypothetical protein [Labedella populi]
MTALGRTPLEPLPESVAPEPESRRSIVFVVGVIAFLAFAVLRIVVAIDRAPSTCRGTT